MSAAITAIAISAAATLYGAEQQRLGQSKADDLARDERNKVETELAWQKKKKGINDQNAALAALRIRNDAEAGTTPGAAGSGTVTPMGPLGSIGGNKMTAAQSVNTPLGL